MHKELLKVRDQGMDLKPHYCIKPGWLRLQITREKKKQMLLQVHLYFSPENWAQQTAPGAALLRTEEEGRDDTEMLLLQ